MPSRIDPDPATLLELLHSRARRVGDCLLWQGATNPDGYGRLMATGSRAYVHRLVWELNHGPIPAGLRVCHECDTPSCIEIGHLWLGTQSQNLRDAWRKGRMSHRRNPPLDPPDVLTSSDVEQSRASNIVSIG